MTSDEEIDELLSDAFEFDYMSQDVLSAAVRLLTTAQETSDDLAYASYPVRLPFKENAVFWVDEMLTTVSPQSPALSILSGSQERREYASKKIHDMFHSQLSALDISHISFPTNESQESSVTLKGHLFVGSFAAAESRLALAALHVTHIIQLSCHPLDELWIGDGVRYSTNILPGCESKGTDAISSIMVESAGQVASTLQDPRKSMSGEDSSVLVTCSTGDEYSPLVCALFLMQTFGCDEDTAMEYMVRDYAGLVNVGSPLFYCCRVIFLSVSPISLACADCPLFLFGLSLFSPHTVDQATGICQCRLSSSQNGTRACIEVAEEGVAAVPEANVILSNAFGHAQGREGRFSKEAADQVQRVFVYIGSKY